MGSDDIFAGVTSCLDDERKGRVTIESQSNAELKITVSGMTVAEVVKIEEWLTDHAPVPVSWMLYDEHGPVRGNRFPFTQAVSDEEVFAQRFRERVRKC